MHILVADDDRVALESISAFLARRDHRLTTAETGPEACRCVEEDPPDLVITDIQMPGMDGIALLKAIRERHPDLPVILMTGHETVETAVAALRNRAYDYFRKPVELRDLLVCIDRIGKAHVPPWNRQNGTLVEQ